MGANPLVEFPKQRRSQIRWDVSAGCIVEFGGQSSAATMLDLSQEGAFIQSHQTPDVGEKVDICLLLEDQPQVFAAEVVHERSFHSDAGQSKGFGVRFLEPPPAELVHRMRHAQLLNQSPMSSTSPQHSSQSKSPMDWLLDINKEIWLVFSLVTISLASNFLLQSNEMVLGFYSFPTIFSAYFFGRRHATLTALGSVLLVVLVGYLGAFSDPEQAMPWLQLVVWGGTLVITGYAMGTLYERMQYNISELRETYQGVLVILQHFIAKDKYTQGHSQRVSIYAARIASRLGLEEEAIEDVRVAALLHDIGKLEISRDILYKASRLTPEEYEQIKEHVDRGISLLKPVGGSLRRVLPIILAHHDRFDGSGYHPVKGEEIPMAARIIAVADVYDAVTSDRPYRKAMSPLDAKDMIVKGSGTDFDPRVVQAFLIAFRMGEMEIPEALI